MQKLYEGAGTIDKLYQLLAKAKSSLEKAQNAVLDVADICDEINSESVAVGGSLANTIPSNISANIDKLMKIAETDLEEIGSGTSASSFDKIKELIENTPYRDIKPTTPGENRQARAQMPNISAPDLSQGPQSKISESNEIDLEDFYKSKSNKLNEQEILYHGFSFDQLQESNIFGKTLDPDMMSFANSNKVSLGKYTRQSTQKLREKIESSDEEDEDEKLNESFDPLTFRSPGIGSMGGLTMSNLKE